MSGLRLHALRIAATVAVLFVVSSSALRIAVALALFFAVFSAAHDLVHGALGLGRRANDRLLRATALLMLTSGHAMRRMHMRHHARPLAADDLEGAGATRSLFGALASSPANAVALRVEAYRSAPHHERRTQRVDTVLALVLAAVALVLGGEALRIYVLVTITMHVTAAVWAAHVPHHVPAWVARAVRPLAFLRSPTLLSLAFHEAHHAHPKVPCHRLAELSA